MTSNKEQITKDCIPIDRRNAVVTKDNSLIPALAKMSLSELRLMSFCLSFIDSRMSHRDLSLPGAPTPVPQEQVVFRARVQDLVQVFPSIGEGHAYEVVREAIESINTKPYRNDNFIKPDGEKRRVLYAWFSGMEYSERNGTFEFQISPQIANLVLSLRGNFTRYRLESVYQFKSGLSWKLYENLKQWEKKGQWTVPLDEFRQRLDISGKYPIWNTLRYRVIDVALKEINQFSDIRVSFVKQTRYRAVVAVTFFIESTDEEKKRNDESIVYTVGDTPHDVELLMKAGLTEHESHKLSEMAQEHGYDLAKKYYEVIERYEAKSANERARTAPKVAYIKKALNDELNNLFNDVQPSSIQHLKREATEPMEPIDQKTTDELLSFVKNCRGQKGIKGIGQCPGAHPETKYCRVCQHEFGTLFPY